MLNTCIFTSKVCWYFLCLMLQWFWSKIWWNIYWIWRFRWKRKEKVMMK